VGAAALFAARLEQLVDAKDRARLSGSVTIARRGTTLETNLVLVLDGRELGQRRFETPSCQKAAEASAVAAALAVFAASEAQEPAPETVGSTAPRANIWALGADPVPDFTRDRRPAPLPASRGLEPRVGLLGAVHLGVLPELAPALALELGLAFGSRWSATVSGTVSGEQERIVDEGRSAALRVISGEGRACFAPLVGSKVRLDGCAGVALWWLRGHGQRFDVNRSASLFALAPLLAADLSLRAPRFIEWHLQLQASAPLARARFLVDEREINRARPLTASLRLGPFVRF
jgi:hypothetical protein